MAKRKLDPRKCVFCEIDFIPNVHNQKYCSIRCYRKAEYVRKMERYKKPKPKARKSYIMKNPTSVICCICGGEYIIDNPHSEIGLFYCRKCLEKGGSTIPKLNLGVD